MSKLEKFYQRVLHKPSLVVAPMVDQSEYAWRILSRKYGATLCYTPMFHARLFAENEKYRREQFTTGPDDGPLIVQFCANNPDTLLAAAKLVEDKCDAVDINLGCPQGIAKRGNYGAFLMESWDLIASMVKKLDQDLAIPVTCKIRIFPDVEKTIAYAKMLQEAGCKLLTVHGRLREQKGQYTGLADWEQIRQLKEVLDIPVFANGNILYYEDIDACIKATGCDGIMSAEGNLYNVALFTKDCHPFVWDVAEEYLNIVKEKAESAIMPMVRAHLFKIFMPCLSTHTDIRTELAKVLSLDDFYRITYALKERMEPEALANPIDFSSLKKNEKELYDLPIWVAQPYIRPPPYNKENTEPKPEKRKAEEKVPKEPTESKKARSKRAQCSMCPNATSVKCDYLLCRPCCVINKVKKGETCSQHSPRPRRHLKEKNELDNEYSQVNQQVTTV